MSGSSASAWRRELAAEIAALYASRPGVRAVGLGGSTARDEADDWSDLDVVVLWDEPDVAWLERAPLAEAWGARRLTWLRSGAQGSRLEQYALGALKIDVANAARADLEAVLDALLEQHRSDAALLKAAATWASLEPLSGAAELEAVRARLAAPPRELTRALLRAHLMFFPDWAPRQLCLRRGDWLGLYDYALRACRNLVGLWAALDGVWLATEGELKGVSSLLRRLPGAPARAAERLEALLTAPGDDTLDDLYALIRETLERVAREFPEVDVRGAQALLDFPAAACPEPPPRAR